MGLDTRDASNLLVTNAVRDAATGCIQPISRHGIEEGKEYHLVNVRERKRPPPVALQWKQMPVHGASAWLSCEVPRRPAHVMEGPVRPMCHVMRPAPAVVLVPQNRAELPAAVACLEKAVVVLLDQQGDEVADVLHTGEPTVSIENDNAVITWRTMAFGQKGVS